MGPQALAAGRRCGSGRTWQRRREAQRVAEQLPSQPRCPPTQRARSSEAARAGPELTGWAHQQVQQGALGRGVGFLLTSPSQAPGACSELLVPLQDRGQPSRDGLGKLQPCSGAWALRTTQGHLLTRPQLPPTARAPIPWVLVPGLEATVGQSGLDLHLPHSGVQWPGASSPPLPTTAVQSPFPC